MIPTAILTVTQDDYSKIFKTKKIIFKDREEFDRVVHGYNYVKLYCKEQDTVSRLYDFSFDYGEQDLILKPVPIMHTYVETSPERYNNIIKRGYFKGAFTGRDYEPLDIVYFQIQLATYRITYMTIDNETVTIFIGAM